MINPAFDLTGEIFGKWTVLERIDPPEHIVDRARAYWLCRCECGREAIVIGKNLRIGHSKSCGCALLLQDK